MDLLSFFCGPGGLDQGFREAQFNTIAATDASDAALSTYSRNHDGVLVEPIDLLEANTQSIIAKLLRTRVGSEPLGVIGGPPCQSFSDSNVHQRDNDLRHTLPLRYAEVLKSLNAMCGVSFFVFENVPGLLRPKHAARYSAFKDSFSAAGFTLFEALLNAHDYGVPQQRPRVIIVGLNRKLHPLAHWQAPNKTKRRMTVRDAIFGLPDPVQFRRGLTPSDIPFHPNHWCMAPKSKKFQSSDLRPGQSFGRSFRTLEWDQPSWSVAYGHREVHVHPSGTRRLSVYEAMRLQSFPKKYVLCGSLSQQIKQVSDAVPPPMAKAIAKSIARSLDL